MTIKSISNENVFGYISRGSHIICCDFEKTEMLDCNNMTVSKLYGKLGNNNCKFYSVENEVPAN